ncbi:hypothetical protein BU23DRAFT_327157 [Bimuria novae-zelandiae CBS 107.79]|uniref:Na+/H+ antiporter-like protein Nha1 n=1 Tax=Bimuria novae-zelandiae CBS 107.79 TaxID=1447943 RepID=A0A6A5UR10_9PLEO|nr:hypothetical protein BU23DRAFT_327157 [Bimuria novae-zelandiae CBS 107.79]
MAWDHLSINKPHLVYIILGGFTSLFMLCSSVIKERLYIGEATVATICGIIFGPHAADLINPRTWGNVDVITLEFSRIVLVVQCFAVGVELPKAYMEKHWKSVTLLLIPVMTFGWLITSLFVWWMFGAHLNWLESLCIAACVTATDPVLASSVVGKGKFAKRVPKHLRDLLSAESGCNDGMAFPFVYLAIYIIRYHHQPDKVALHWFCYTILYECLFGAIFGVAVGYAARRAIRYAHDRDLVDRESFLVFYFVLALFCAGAGSLLGMDDLLVGFACGVGFSNDGWFLEKTEESHVSNVIDLLINLAFFVYFGTIIPWEMFNAPHIGITPWRLVVLGILVLFFRRIPIMLALKPLIPDIKTWREALFAGHFGPIGVGGLFVAILARAELETETTTPLETPPKEGTEFWHTIEMIWPITCFLVICSILVHGSSIAVFTLGKHINTLTISLSYTQANEDGPTWMDRLPRIQSRSKSSVSLGRRPSESDFDEKETTGPDGLPVVGVPGQFLKRRKAEEENGSRSSSLRPTARNRNRGRWELGRGPGGPISQSAITPHRGNRDPYEPTSPLQERDSDTLAGPSDDSPEGSSSARERRGDQPEEEIYQEGSKTVIEDEEGNVLGVRESRANEDSDERLRADDREAARLGVEKDVEHGVAQIEHGGAVEEAPGKAVDTLQHPSKWRKRMESFSAKHHHHSEAGPAEPPKAQKPERRGPALAYQFGNTIIVEDEDGEVIKKYDIPGPSKERPAVDRKTSVAETGGRALQSLRRMGTYMGVPAHKQESGEASTQGQGAADGKKKKKAPIDEDDDRIRFTVTAGGRRMSKAEFIQQMSGMEPKQRAKFIQDSNVPESVKQDARQDAKDATRRRAASSANVPPVVGEEGQAEIQRIESPEAKTEDRARGPEGLTLIDSNEEDIPFHNVRQNLASYSMGKGKGETAAQRRRREAAEQHGSPHQAQRTEEQADDSDDEDRETSAERQRRLGGVTGTSSPVGSARGVSPPLHPPPKSRMDEGETAAERRRRLGALGMGGGDDPDSESDIEEGGDPLETGRGTHTGARKTEASGAQPGTERRTPGIRFAEQPRIPTKDERAQEDRDKEAAEGSKKGALGRLKWKK